MVDVEEFGALFRRGWPALEEVDVEGWVARFSDGVTQRANSVLPAGAPRDPAGALGRVERLYRDRGLPTVFQVGPVAYPAGLDDLLRSRGYRAGSAAEVWTAPVDAVLARVPEISTEVRVADSPDDDWFDLWWALDGRGDDQARAVASKILAGGTARYVTVLDDRGAAAVGRLALVGEWGGLYCVAVRPDARRRGLGSAVVRGALSGADVRNCWLQVLADNAAARAMYSSLGFSLAATYHYRTLA